MICYLALTLFCEENTVTYIYSIYPIFLYKALLFKKRSIQSKYGHGRQALLKYINCHFIK